MARSPWIVSILPKGLKPAGALLYKTYRTTGRRAQGLVAKWLAPKAGAEVQEMEERYLTGKGYSRGSVQV